MISPLLLGTARVDITPRHPVPLAGFAHRRDLFEGIHSPLFLRALCFSQEDTSGANQRALLISADLFCWGPDLCTAVYEDLARRLGISPGSVILHATHNHSGPQTSHRFSPSLGEPDDRYLEFLRCAVVEAAESASQTLEPVFMERGSGRCALGINRRRIVEGVVEMAPNADGPVDHEVTVVRFRTSNGATKALLVHYGCHPTTSGANEVCAEFPGLAMAALEQDGSLAAAFLQGCCGDVRPALIREGKFYRGGPGDAAALAEDLVAEIRRVLKSEMTSCAPCVLALRQLATPLPLGRVPSKQELLRLQEHAGIEGEWGRLLLAHPGRLAWSPVLDSTWLTLARDLELLTFNAEMVVEYGLYVKQVSQRKLLPVACSNGMIGYVCTKKQIEEGGYECAAAFRYYGNPAPFSAATEAAVLGHVSSTNIDK